MYKARYRTYGALADLGEAGFLTDEALTSGKKDGYTFTTTNVAKSTFQCRAIPDGDGKKAYFIDQTGKVRVSDTKEVGPDSPTMDDLANAERIAKEPPNETAAIASLDLIRAAEAVHKARFNRYASIEQLANAGYIGGDVAKTGKKDGYTFAITNAGEAKYECRAIPNKDGARAFYMDQSGAVRASKTKTVGPDSPELAEKNEQPKPAPAAKGTANEGTAIDVIASIRAAESAFKAKNKRYGDLKELVDGEFLKDDAIAKTGKKDGYSFSVSNAEKNSYECRAVPEGAGNLAFYNDQIGVLRYSKTKEVGPDSTPYKTGISGGASTADKLKPPDVMNAIKSAEDMYREKNGRFGTVKELFDSKFVRIAEFKQDGKIGGYTFTISNAGATRYDCVAVPDKDSFSAYFMSEGGVVMEFKSKSAKDDEWNWESSETPEKRTAMGCLSAIRSAEGMHKARFQRYGTLKELVDSGFICDDELGAGIKSGYKFIIKASKSTWECYAVPGMDGYDAFFMSECGVLQVENNSRKADRNSPAYDSED
jgi:hypothetical protein